MKIIRNEYKQLKRENDLTFSTLAECDRDIITGIVNTVSNTRGIGYEVELVRKDLIAMAAGAETNGESLPAVIGDVDAFKRELLASMPRPKLAAYMLDCLVWLAIYSLVMSLTYLLLEGPGGSHYDVCSMAICILIMMPSAWVMQRLIPSEWLATRKYAYGPAQRALLIVWIVEFWLVYRWIYPLLPVFAIPNAVSSALFAALTLALCGLRIRRYNQLATDRPWREITDR